MGRSWRNLKRSPISRASLTANLDWCFQLQKNRLAEKELSRLEAQASNLVLRELYSLSRPRASYCDKKHRKKRMSWASDFARCEQLVVSPNLPAAVKWCCPRWACQRPSSFCSNLSSAPCNLYKIEVNAWRKTLSNSLTTARPKTEVKSSQQTLIQRASLSLRVHQYLLVSTR